MQANTRNLERIFDQTITYQIPLFQRPYVWTKEENWEPLWEDIQSLLDKYLLEKRAHPHFLGAVVLEQLSNSTGSIESRQVIDGQQRFTTLQLFLIAARDLARINEAGKYIDRFNDLVENRRSKIDNDDEIFKVWPTNSNRNSFRIVHKAGSPNEIDRIINDSFSDHVNSNNVIDGYKYFFANLKSWLSAEFDEDFDIDGGISLEDRFDSLWHVVKDCLQVVVIDLDKNDETQVIFETLNARGEDLLPADLIKNFLFRRAVAEDADVEQLYDKYWQQFETDWWREPVKQGRLTRPRIDIFINHYLAMMTLDDIKSSHLFNAFKAFVNADKTNETSLLIKPESTSDHISQLARFAEIFRKFYEPKEHPRLALFIRRLEAVDTSTVYPFMLYAYGELLPSNINEFDKILHLLESYLIRRMVCNLTGKNYNRYFVDLIRAVDKQGVLSVDTVSEFMNRSVADSARYPSNMAFETAITDLPMYSRLAQYKVRIILEALDIYAHTRKSEFQLLPEGLTIEHVMPQSWQEHWPLRNEEIVNPETGMVDLLLEQKAIQRREKKINTLGNLTLITDSLNPALSNSSWRIKRPELLKFSKLNLTQYFHGVDTECWTEEDIEHRTKYLCEQLTTIWPALSKFDKQCNCSR